MFRVSGEDASRLASIIGPSMKEDIRHDLVSLPNHVALVGIRPSDPRKPFLLYRVRMSPPPRALRDREEAMEIVRRMRETYKASEREMRIE